MQNFLAVNEYRFTLAQKEGKWNLTVVFYNGNNVIDWYKCKDIKGDVLNKVNEVDSYIQKSIQKNLMANSIRKIERISVMEAKIDKILKKAD